MTPCIYSLVPSPFFSTPLQPDFLRELFATCLLFTRCPVRPPQASVPTAEPKLLFVKRSVWWKTHRQGLLALAEAEFQRDYPFLLLDTPAITFWDASSSFFFYFSLFPPPLLAPPDSHVLLCPGLRLVPGWFLFPGLCGPSTYHGLPNLCLQLWLIPPSGCCCHLLNI